VNLISPDGRFSDIYLGLVGLTYVDFTRVPTGFIPQQDQG
jgi:hypothetical protein